MRQPLNMFLHHVGDDETGALGQDTERLLTLLLVAAVGVHGCSLARGVCDQFHLLPRHRGEQRVHNNQGSCCQPHLSLQGVRWRDGQAGFAATSCWSCLAEHIFGPDLLLVGIFPHLLLARNLLSK